MIDNNDIKKISKKIQLSIFFETSAIKLKFLIFFHIFLVIGSSCFFMESLNVYNFDYIFLSCFSLVSMPFPMSTALFLDASPLIYQKKFFLLFCAIMALILLAFEISPILFNDCYRSILTNSLLVPLCYIISFLIDAYCIFIITKIALFDLK